MTGMLMAVVPNPQIPTVYANRTIANVVEGALIIELCRIEPADILARAAGDVQSDAPIQATHVLRVVSSLDGLRLLREQLNILAEKLGLDQGASAPLASVGPSAN